MQPTFKTKVLIYQSKANIDVKTFLLKSLISQTQKLRNGWIGVGIGAKIPHSILVHGLLAF